MNNTFQSRRSSLAESLVNIVVGYAINFFANALIFPALGFPITVRQNLALGAFFTVVSVLRSYGIRRLFNRHLKKAKR